MTTDSERLYCIDMQGVTLNGKPAQVSGRLARYAVVESADQRYEWSWDTAYHVCATQEGRFIS